MVAANNSKENGGRPRRLAHESKLGHRPGHRITKRFSLEEQFRLLVDSVVDYAIFLLDTNGQIVTWNKGANRIKGYTTAEIVGQHFSIFYTPEDLARHHPQEVLLMALQEGRFEEEGWRVRKDGTRFLADVVITPLYDPDGRHVGFAKVTRDITDRKQSEENRFGLMQEQVSRRFLKEILYSVTEGRLRFCDSDKDLPEKLEPWAKLHVTGQNLCDVRKDVLGVAVAIGLPIERAQDVVTAVSEAAMNAVVHATVGECEICAGDSEGRPRIQVWVRDKGTGIALAQVHRATLERGFTTQGSLGHGFWLMLNTCDRIWLLTDHEGTTLVLEMDREELEPQWMSQALNGATQIKGAR